MVGFLVRNHSRLLVASVLLALSVVALVVPARGRAAPAPPTVSQPAISGVAQEDRTLNATATLTGDPEPTVQWQWLRCADRARSLHVDSRCDFERTHSDGRRRRLPASRARARDQRVWVRRGAVNSDGHRDRGVTGPHPHAVAEPQPHPQPITGPHPQPIAGAPPPAHHQTPPPSPSPDPTPTPSRAPPRVRSLRGDAVPAADACHERCPGPSRHASASRGPQSNAAAPLLLRPFPVVRIKGAADTDRRARDAAHRARAAWRPDRRPLPWPQLPRPQARADRDAHPVPHAWSATSRPARASTSWSPGRTASASGRRFTSGRGAPPTRRDRCVLPGGRSPVPCPIG